MFFWVKFQLSNADCHCKNSTINDAFNARINFYGLIEFVRPANVLIIS